MKPWSSEPPPVLRDVGRGGDDDVNVVAKRDGLNRRVLG